MALGSHLEVGGDGVAVITLENGKVNAMHPTVLRQLFDNLKKCQTSPDVKAIVITGANGVFSGGFDISKFQDGGADEELSSNVNKSFLDLVETGPKPTVAALSKIALGGGCELAVSCNARVATPGTKIGLPELQLGIIPGFGGTQRLPRLVGLQQAITMMLTSQPITAEKGINAGLIDAVVPPAELLPRARALALDIANLRIARKITIDHTARLESLAEAETIFKFAREEATKKAGPLRHPQLCIDAIEAGVRHGGRAGLLAEASAFATATRLPVHKALVHMFFAQRTTKNVKGVTDTGLAPRKLSVVAVLGGGLMGSGIATALTLAGYSVIIKEINHKFLDAGLARVAANLASRVKRRAMTAAARDAALARVSGAITYDGFGKADMVIEAAVERLDVKQDIFAEVERWCRPDAVLATNTSTINLDAISEKMRGRERLVGAHFFSPAHVMPLLEIVRTQRSSTQALLDTLHMGLTIKKTPVIVGNCTGFAVNRVFFPYTMGACLLADLGADIYQVDTVVKNMFGMPMGPFRLTDLVGGDIGLHVGRNFIDSFPERVVRSQLIPMMNKAGRLGEKTGRGFYVYKDRKPQPDPSVQDVISASRAASGLDKFSAVVKGMKPAELLSFIFFPVVNEGCRVIAEGIVDKPADLDVASVMAMGFPAVHGGLIFWADTFGAKAVCDTLRRLAVALPPVAGFFEPCEYLVKCAESGARLGDGPGSAARSKM